MKPVILFLAVAGAGLIGLGLAGMASGRSADERVGSAPFVLAGGAALVLDVVLLLAWLLIRA